VIHYRQTQVSWPAVIPLLVTLLVVGWVLQSEHLELGLGIAVAVVTLVLLLFASLTVTVDDTGVEARFGVGLIRKRVPFDRIRSVQVVRNPWYYGWGIKLLPGGMLYNASGLSAVELRLANGRWVRIGSAEPDVLASALRRAAPAVVNDPGPPRPRSTLAFVGAVVGGIAGAIGLAFGAWVMYTGMQPPAVEVTAENLSVHNGLYSNTVPLRRIDTATLDDRIPRVGLKTNGFAAGDTLRGTFRLDNWGSTRLYVNLNSPPFVVVRTQDGVVVVNFKDPERTREMYAQLTHALDRSR
jgi:hypothetical protein